MTYVRSKDDQRVFIQQTTQQMIQDRLQQWAIGLRFKMDRPSKRATISHVRSKIYGKMFDDVAFLVGYTAIHVIEYCSGTVLKKDQINRHK